MKRVVLGAVALMGAGSIGVWGQGVEALRAARQDFVAASKEIAASDGSLEKEIGQGDAVQRIDAAEQRRRMFGPRRQRYYLAARAYYQGQLEPLRKAVAGAAASAEERIAFAGALEPEVAADGEALSAELATGESRLGSQYQGLKQLIEDFGELGSLVRSWRGSLERGGLPEGEVLMLRAKVIAAMEQLVADFGVRESGLGLETEAWTQWFQGLREQARRRQATVAAAGVGQLQRQEIDEGLQRRVRPTVAPPTNFAGSWVFLNMDVVPSNNAPDRVIKVKISQEGSLVKGTYDALVALPAGDRTDPRIRFEFEGEVGSDLIVGRVTSPSTGKITLKLRDLNTLQIDWEVVNNGRMAFLGGDAKVLNRWMGQ